MKEYLTSFKVSGNPFAIQEKASVLITLIVGIFLLSSGAVCVAQSTEPGQASISNVLAEPIASEWKSYTEYKAVITAYKTNTTNKLAQPNLPASEKALYTGLDLLLTYIQADLETQNEVAPLADKNYKIVITESHSDPVLQNLPLADFNVLYDELVVKLRH